MSSKLQLHITTQDIAVSVSYFLAGMVFSSIIIQKARCGGNPIHLTNIAEEFLCISAMAASIVQYYFIYQASIASMKTT